MTDFEWKGVMQSVSGSTGDLVREVSPDNPVFVFRPHRVSAAAEWYTTHFPGETYYAVKANPALHIIQALWHGGVRGFDVASCNEIQLVHSLFPNAKLAFMHPIKNRKVITRAYNEFGVRRFVLDSPAELSKILAATNNATDLTLIVRFSVSNYGSSLPLTGKFGAKKEEIAQLLVDTRLAASSLGVSFHVGSQALMPAAYEIALSNISQVIASTAPLNGGEEVRVDIVDVGGGFPSIYDMESPPPLGAYIEAITNSLTSSRVLKDSTLWCEPGRALSAESESLLTRIEGVKTGTLYLNDGSFGALYDAVHERWNFPIRAISSNGVVLSMAPEELVPYTVYGPTCDSADCFPSPVLLPRGLDEGDYLEFGNIGAYGRSMSTRFNGFGEHDTIQVTDSPWPSLYTPPVEEPALYFTEAAVITVSEELETS